MLAEMRGISHLKSPLVVDLDADSGEGAAASRLSDKEKGGKLINSRRKSKRKREREIEAAEEKLLNPGIPESEDDFEKLVLGSPNSSFAWLKYTEFSLSSGGPTKARLVLERALARIDTREESERQNIWVAYLNLESRFGSPKNETFTRVFQRASEQCEVEKLHMGVIEIYQSSGEELLLEQHMKLLEKKKKIRKSSALWLVRLPWYFKNNRKDGEEMLSRALRGIPQHEIVTFRARLGVNRFRCGDTEMGRTMFEELMQDYPKRTDLWSMYIDQEVRVGDAPVIRSLFERATCLNLPSKKMRFLFKKNLEYEKTMGDADRVKLVKRKAMEYVDNC